MQNVMHRQIRPWVSGKKKNVERSGGIQFLYRPEIVARDGRYVAYENRVVCDCFSGLEWLPGPDRDMSWEEGYNWAKGLSTGGGGWRLPTLEELRGLYKKNKRGDNISPVFAICSTDVWSCEETQDAASAWGFNFLPGNQFRTYKTYSSRFRVMAVRPRKYYAYERKTKVS
jgi:Protein of unknown function (DUF1566)